MRKTFFARTLYCLMGIVLLTLAYSFHEQGAITAPTPLHTEPDVLAEIAAYPKDYFQSPVDADIKLTGTFGELRPDHFHSGIDIKSKTGGVGQPVFIAADGFVDQIKVQSGGYGNVLYVKHPNGYTTVYAHLDRFAPEIAEYVKAQQYEKERFEIELKPKDGLFKFKKGQEIGKLGNSGGSSGPHLHFEVRNSATGKALNPQLFGLPIPDKTAPSLRDMKVYFLAENREVLGSKALPIVHGKDGQYRLKGGDTLRLGAWRVGFGAKVYDEMSGFKNDNGIFGLHMSVADKTAFTWRMDELDFDETRYLNAHIDYQAKKKFGAYFHRCFLLPGNRMSNYAHSESGGLVTLYKENPVKITIKATDAGSNYAEITFWVIRDEANMQTFSPLPHQYELPFDAENHIDLDDFSMQMPKNCLYEPLAFRYQTTPDNSTGVYSSVHHIHDESTPVQRYFEIAIKPFGLPDELRSKAVVANCGDGKPDNCGGTWEGDKISTKIRTFGNYCIMADTEAPSIKPVIFDDDMRRKSSMSFRINDNFGIGGSADGLSFRGEVDGQWILFEYDRKRDRLTHTFDEHINSGQHTLRLTVKDDRGNVGVFERAFTR